MNDLEQMLRDMNLTRPSADLDRRISETLESAREAPEPTFRAGQRLRFLALAASGVAVIFLLAQFVARHHQQQPTVYRIEATGRLRQLLLEPPSTGDSHTPFNVSGSAPQS
jgi:hypothetical protein